MDLPSEPTYESSLRDPAQRWLAHVIEHGLSTGLRTPEQFIHHFEPRVIMLCLAEHPTRRAQILEECIGLRPRIGLRKSPESAGEDLQIAIEEGETDAATIMRLFEPDDRVRFLERKALWAYVCEPRHWEDDSTQRGQLAKVREHTLFILERGVAEGLANATDIVNAISCQTLVQHLPRDEVATILERALIDGRQGTPFVDEAFLEAVGLPALVEHIPLPTLWDWVITAKMAGASTLSTETGELFDAREAHPDAHGVTVARDPSGAETVAGK